MNAVPQAGSAPAARSVGPPLWLLLELTYRCPLHCVFCYNPTEFAKTGPELSTAQWLRVLERGARTRRGAARALGRASRSPAMTSRRSSRPRTRSASTAT